MRIWGIALLVGIACRFDASGTVGTDAAPPQTDAQPGDAGGPSAEVELLRMDPFGDGTPVAYIADFAGRVYLGPSADGTHLVRCRYDASSVRSVDIQFLQDTTGSNTHDSAGTSPYPGIGYTGCTVDTDCGPDNEDGRGMFSSGTIAGTEWLILAGARQLGDLDYVYMTDDISTGPIDFLFVDLTDVLGGQTKGLSTIHVHQDHTYLGFPDTGGSQPYLIDLFATPSSPGLDAVSGTDTIDLDARNFPNLADDPTSDGNTIIDTMTSYNDKLYFANDAVWLRSRMSTPGSDPADYSKITPVEAAFTNKESRGTPKTADILPADRAVPSIVEYQGVLFAARNTLDGPQLWRCSPGRETCDDADWKFFAANTTGDLELSQFNNPNNTSITLLESTGTHLYVGFDNATDGVVLYRTSDPAPREITDFEGQDGCVAGDGCPGLGGNGIGRGENVQFLDSEAIDVGSGQVFVYAAVGDASAPLNLYRFAP